LLFLFRLKLIAEGELKDMEQFFDDLSDSFSGTEPEVHKTSVIGKQLLPAVGGIHSRYSFAFLLMEE